MEAIRSVHQFVDVPCEIIVIDNASSDGTPAFILKSFPNVKLIANTGNAGFSKANNQGAALAKGQYVMLLNPDAKLINSDWKKALAYLHTQPQTMLGPRILNPDLTLQDSVFYPPTVATIFKETFFISYFESYHLEKVVNSGNFALSGACLLLLRTNYLALGGLDEDLFWMDDVDFCYRAKQAGMSLVYFNAWEIVHVTGQSGKTNYSVSIANQLISKLKFFKKYRQWFNFCMALLLTELQIVTRLLLFMIAGLFSRTAFLKFKAYGHTQILLIRYIFTGKKRTF